jgi:RNA polymerase sigma factor (sigma-70 family)
MGHVPGLLSGPNSGPDSRTPTTQELKYLRHTAVSIALSQGLSYQDAQDVAQSALLIVWSRAADINERQAYMRTVARREAWRLHGNRRDQPLAPDKLAFLTDYELADGKQIDDYLVEEDQVRGWISQLPPAQAAVISLLMDGIPPTELADHLQIPKDVVRVRLRTAREKLRTIFIAQMTADRQAEQPPVTRRTKLLTRPPAATTPSAREETDLADLPPRQQEVLRLTRRGYKPAQIARALAISPNTVRVNLFHARKRLRQATGAAA